MQERGLACRNAESDVAKSQPRVRSRAKSELPPAGAADKTRGYDLSSATHLSCEGSRKPGDPCRQLSSQYRVSANREFLPREARRDPVEELGEAPARRSQYRFQLRAD